MKKILLIVLIPILGYSYERLTYEEAIDLIKGELSTNNASNINNNSGLKHSDVSVLMKWKAQQDRILEIISKTEDTYGFRSMTDRDLLSFTEGVLKAKRSTKNKEILTTLSNMYTAARQERVYRLSLRHYNGELLETNSNESTKE